MPANKRHHFVPQFYLRNFSVRQEERQIGLFNLKNERFVPATSIKTQAQRNRLYGNGEGEQVLSELEGIAAEIVRRSLRTSTVPKRFSPDHHALLVYVLFQMTRTPAAGQEIQDAFEQQVKAMAAQDSQMAPFVNHFDVVVENPVHQAMGIVAQCHPLAADLAYKLLINRTTSTFITSDHPVILYNQFMEHRRAFGSGTGIVCKGLQIFLPLNPRVVLIFYDYDVYRVGGRSLKNQQVAVTEKDVHALNLLQGANAHEQLFFDDSINEETATRIAAKSKVFRPFSRSELKQFELCESNGRKSILLHSKKNELRIGLHLSCVEELPSIRHYRLGGQVVHVRDRHLCELHDEFLKKVDAKQYKASEFSNFVNDKAASARTESNIFQ